MPFKGGNESFGTKMILNIAQATVRFMERTVGQLDKLDTRQTGDEDQGGSMIRKAGGKMPKMNLMPGAG